MRTSPFLPAAREFGHDRRAWLRLAAAGVLGASASGWLANLAAHAEQERAAGKRPKSCILLWMDGGPSQVHTFNLPTAGDFQEFKGMPTAVPGIRISEHLPKLAAQMGDLALLRTMSTGVNIHGLGQYLMHVGHRKGPFNYPSLGAIVAKEQGRPDLGLPSYVVVGGGGVPANYRKSGTLGPDCSPLMVAKGVENIKSPEPGRDAIRAALLDQIESDAVERFQSDALLAHQASYRKAFELMHSDKNKVFDLKLEPAAVQEAYGASDFGKGCLLARRLVETGVSFVEVNWGGWDSHGGGGNHLKKNSPTLDAAFSALLRDLKERGLLDTTLIVWMGEFGRGPRPGLGGGINGGIGSGHYAACWTTVLAGAGLKTGQVIGRSTADACEVEERPISAGDFMATICQALGIAHDKKYDLGGRQVPYTAFGSQPIAELF